MRRFLTAATIAITVGGLAACGDPSDTSSGVENEPVYCVDAKWEIVDPDYCDETESEYDPMNYWLYVGAAGQVLQPGFVIEVDDRDTHRRVRPNDRAARSSAGLPATGVPTRSQAPRTSVSNGGGSTPQRTQQAPRTQQRQAPAPAPRRTK